MTVSAAIEKRQETPTNIISTYTSDFALVLPQHFKAETFVRLAQGVLRQNKDLMEAATNSPGSLLVALLDAARLGHEPGTDAYYLIPRKGKNGRYVQGIEGYRGVLERMMNSANVESVVAEAVYENDDFDWNPGTMRVPTHKPKDGYTWFSDRGQCVGAYAYAIFTGGAVSKVAVIGEKRLRRARQASDGSDSQYSPWNRDYDKMVVKTALRDLEPYVPKSADVQIREAENQAKAADAAQGIDLPEGAINPITGEMPMDEGPIEAELVVE